MVNILNLIRTGSVWGSGDNAWWWVVFGGLEYGPVSTAAMAQLCADGIVREDTPVRSTRFRRRVRAADVPALLPQISPIAADAKVVEATLRGIPMRKLGVRWYQLYPLEPLASACAVGILLAGAAFAAYARYTDAAPGAVARTFLVPLLSGWLCAAVSWRVTRERRRVALCAFWLGAATVLCAALFAPQRRRAADALTALTADAPARVEGNPAPATAPTAAPVAALGETDQARLSRVARWAVVEFSKGYVRYDEAVRGLKLEEVWQPARLVDPATYPDANRRCDAVRRALRELGEQAEQVHAAVGERVRASGASTRLQEQFLAEYATHRDDARAAYRAFAAEEKQLLLEIEGLLEFLGERSGTGAMTARDGQLLFRDRADAQAFNKRAARLTAAAVKRSQRVAVNRDQASKESPGKPPSADAR